MTQEEQREQVVQNITGMLRRNNPNNKEGKA